jgi:hypothetical protein
MTPLLTPAARPLVPDSLTPPPPLTLLGADGRPLKPGQDGWVAPHALSFASVINTVTQVYSYRWDEALKDSPANALANKRDAYYLGLLQERVAGVVGLNWRVKVPKSSGRKGQWVTERLTAAVEAVPDFLGMLLNQSEAVWYGRYGSQVVPGRGAGGVWTVKEHRPVNGDKIQYAWDGTPVVQIGYAAAARYHDERGTVVDWQTGKPAVTITDRGGYGLRLHTPAMRERFVIHHHVADDADYFQGEMAGGVHGVGLRSRVYWSGWMRTETLGWMLSFMEGVGMMDLIVFNYPSGNAEAKKVATDNAKRVTNGLALLVARGPEELGYPAVEQIQLNTQGVQVLQDLIANYFDRHVERLFVGQSMSGGGGGAGGLEGDGRAQFAQDTKFQLLKMDAKRLGETLTRDLLGWMQRTNCPGTEDIPASFEFAVPDPAAEGKLNSVTALMDKMKFKQDEVYELVGMTAPGPHDETVGGQPAPGMPGQPTGDPEAGADPGREATPGGDGGGMPDESEMPDDLLAGGGWPELYRQADQWQAHTIAAGPRKGRQAYMNPRTGELRDAPPGQAPAPANPNAVQRAGAAVKGLGRHLAGAASSALDEMPGGRVVKALGRGAVAVFHAVEKPLMAAMATTQQLARQAAYERGMSDSQVDVLGRVLAAADFAGGYATAAAGYAVGGAVGAKVGSFMPSASVVYLAYSTARDPQATWRAAKRLVRARLAQAGRAAGAVGGAVAKAAGAASAGLDRVADLTHRAAGATGFEGGEVPEFYQATPDLAGRLADSLKAAHDPDWWQACVLAGLGAGASIEDAVRVAGECADAKPVPDGAEIGAAMVHLATAGDWPGVGRLADLFDSHPDGDDDAPERYARTPAKWTSFAHKSGRPAWRSAGGLVRFTDPTAGRAATPEGPTAPKRLLDARANQDAQRRAVEITNRLAQGHPPGVDELAGLPALLHSLTSAQLLALNKTVGGHGGKLKADRIAHYIGRVNSTLTAPAARPAEPQPAPTPQADKPRPKYGLKELLPHERSDYAPPPNAPAKSKLEREADAAALAGSLNKPSTPTGQSAARPSRIAPAARTSAEQAAKNVANLRLAAEAADKRGDGEAAAKARREMVRQASEHGVPLPPPPPPSNPTVGERMKAVSGRWAKLFDRLTGGTGEGLESGEVVELVPAPEAERYAAAHAPPGGVTVQGKEYPGGQFIPADVMARATAAEREAVAGGRAAGPGGATPKPKTERQAKPKAVTAASRFKDVARKRRVAHAVRNEGELAKAIGAFNLPDSEPADVVVMCDHEGNKLTTHKAIRDGLARREAAVLTLRTGKLHGSSQGQVVRSGKPADAAAVAFARQVLGEPAQFVEVKTLLKSPKDAVAINRAAQKRKERWVRKYGVSFSVVVMDDRKGAKHSGHRLYVLPHGWHQTIRLDQMEKADSLAAVLDKIEAGADTGKAVAEVIALRKRA